MTTYIDSYFDSDDANAFLSLLASEPNIIGPLPGVAELGSDPARLYLAVRSTAPLETPAGCAVTPPETGIALLGVWA